MEQNKTERKKKTKQVVRFSAAVNISLTHEEDNDSVCGTILTLFLRTS